MKSESVRIFAGTKVQYTDKTYSIERAKEIIQEWVDTYEDCVSFTETEFLYKNGNEKGFIVEFINYPRFPREPQEAFQRAKFLAQILTDELEQFRITFQDNKTVEMISNPKL
jgi:hypothetical protein